MKIGIAGDLNLSNSNRWNEPNTCSMMSRYFATFRKKCKLVESSTSEGSAWKMESQPDKILAKNSLNNPYSKVLRKTFSFSDNERKIGNDLLITLKIPLIIGACLGLIPIHGIWKTKGSFKWFHYRTVLSIVVTTALILHTSFISYDFLLKIFRGKNSARDLILTISGVWFYSVGCIVYAFFLLRAERLCRFFAMWKENSVKISHCLIPDKKLQKVVIITTAIVLLDCIGENILYHIHAMTPEQRKNIKLLPISKFLQDYFNSNQYIHTFFEYNVAISALMLITNKLATIVWNFGDLILILIARVLHERFWALNEFVKFKLDISKFPNNASSKATISWSAVRDSFHQLCGLLREANHLFTPLIWLSCATDVFFICRQIYEGFAPRPSQETTIDKVYIVWSLLHLIGRTLAVNMTAVAMSEEAHRTFHVIQYCPPSDYNEEVRRLEIFLGGRIIGLEGGGCFIITRSFVKMLISAIFTLEVVLLQNSHITFG